MNNSNKLSYDQAIAKWGVLSDAFPEHKQLLNDIRESIFSDYRGAYGKWRRFVLENKNLSIPENLFEELYLTGNGLSPRKALKINSPKNQQNRNILNVPFKPDESTIRQLKTDERFEKVLTKEAVKEATGDRTEEAYKYSEEYVFKEWCKNPKNKPDNPDYSDPNDKEAFEKYRTSEKGQREADEKYIKENSKKVDLYVALERTRIYENPNEDPIIKELNKILTEEQEKFNKKTDEEKKKDPRNRIVKKSILTVFKEKFPAKTSEYLQWQKKTNDKNQLIPLDVAKTEIALQELYLLDTSPVETERRQAPQQTAPQQQPLTASTQQPIAQGGGPSSSRLPNPLSKGINKGAKKLGKNFLNQAGKQALQQGLRSAATAIASATWEIWVPILIGLVILILVMAIIIGGGGNAVANPNGQENQLSITKTGPDHIDNGASATFNINVSFSGQADQIVVTDPVPDGTQYVSCTPSDACSDVNGVVTWTLSPSNTTSTTNQTTQGSDIANSTSTQTTTTTFDYSKYGYPVPQNPNPLLNSSGYKAFLDTWNNYMGKYAIKAGGIIEVDPGMIGSWAFIEGDINTFYDNCDDGKYGGDYDPNTPCFPHDGKNWQIGYGIRPLDGWQDDLQEAVNKMYSPGANIAQIGQAVIDNSKTRSKTPITYPSVFPPDKTIQDIVNGSKGGDKLSRQLLGILIKDDAIGTYLVGKDMKGYADLGAKMAGDFQWPKGNPYYAPSKLTNYFDAVYRAGTPAGGAIDNSPVNSYSASLTVTLKATKNDIYIVNQAFAEAVGGNSGTNSETGPNSGANTGAGDNIGGTSTSANCPAGTDMGLQTGYTDGKPQTIRICAVQGIQVNSQISQNVNDLLNAVKSAGYNMVSGSSGFRTEAQQIELRKENHCPDIYNSPSYLCTPDTARPGHSNHQMGLAIDFDCNGSSIKTHSNACFIWMSSNAATYGLKNFPAEPWHWSVDGH